MTNVGPMGRRNEWEIYGIRNVSQFCKTTIKHELNRRAKEFFVEPKYKPNSTRGPVPATQKERKLPRATQCYNFHSFRHFPSAEQEPHPAKTTKNKKTRTKQRQKIGGVRKQREKERGNDYKILLCVCVLVHPSQII